MKKVGITPGPVKFENMEPNDVKQFTPSNAGTEGQILTKTSNGYNWETPSAGSDVEMIFHSVGEQFKKGQIEHGDILVDSPKTINAMITYDIKVKGESQVKRGYTDLKTSVLFTKGINGNYYHGNCALTPYTGNTSNMVPILINTQINATVSTGETTWFYMSVFYTGVFKKTYSNITIDDVELKITGIDFYVNQ